MTCSSATLARTGATPRQLLGDAYELLRSCFIHMCLSPEAVKSERCVWEVDRTIELSKRLLPVIFKPVPVHDIQKS